MSCAFAPVRPFTRQSQEPVSADARRLFGTRIVKLEEIVRTSEAYHKQQDANPDPLTFFGKALRNKDPLALYLDNQFNDVAFGPAKVFTVGNDQIWSYLANELRALKEVTDYLEPSSNSPENNVLNELPKWLQGQLKPVNQNAAAFQWILNHLSKTWHAACIEYLQVHGAIITTDIAIAEMDLSHSPSGFDEEVSLPALSLKWTEGAGQTTYRWTGSATMTADGEARTEQLLQCSSATDFISVEGDGTIRETLSNRGSRMLPLLDFAAGHLHPVKLDPFGDVEDDEDSHYPGSEPLADTGTAGGADGGV
ncbi:hypothetical protein QFC22_004413 [Naganishia vaughanmartiniae]|uniref:Uncharacterized protein n=1 Tax=Naganishia vaughanmartiniae TaxID=1424756 RepID=A0ACC2X0N7_9TREE|nr:hypothetical protein QFC22_004413 [Naganishia vaughanmartiniae]